MHGDFGYRWPQVFCIHARRRLLRQTPPQRRERHQHMGRDTPLTPVKRLLDQLLPHANAHEIHRELRFTPHTARPGAWRKTLGAARGPQVSVVALRLEPANPHARRGMTAQSPVGPERLALAAPPRATVIRCLRPDGDRFCLRHTSDPKAQPIRLRHCPVF